jgi:hypothetical protein
MVELNLIAKAVLYHANWVESRDVDIAPWIEGLNAIGYPFFPEVGRVLKKYGGLKIGWENSIPFVIDNKAGLVGNDIVYFYSYPNYEFDPLGTPDSDRDSLPLWNNHPFITKHRLQIVPIGSYKGIATLFMTSDSRIYLGHFATKHDYSPALQPKGDNFEDFLSWEVLNSLYYL